MSRGGKKNNNIHFKYRHTFSGVGAAPSVVYSGYMVVDKRVQLVVKKEQRALIIFLRIRAKRFGVGGPQCQAAVMGRVRGVM